MCLTHTILDDPDISKPSSSGSSLTEMIVSLPTPPYRTGVLQNFSLGAGRLAAFLSGQTQSSICANDARPFARAIVQECQMTLPAGTAHNQRANAKSVENPCIKNPPKFTFSQSLQSLQRQPPKPHEAANATGMQH